MKRTICDPPPPSVAPWAAAAAAVLVLVFASEAAARRLRLSRSKFYATAIAEFLERRQSNALTERLDEVYSRQRARVALEMRHAFAWPSDKDSAQQDKLRDFVNQRLDNVDEFVLFDPSDRTEIEFPRGWQPLQMAAVGPK